MKTEFNIGDRVEVMSDDGFEEENIGRVGTIDKTDQTNLPIRVKFDTSSTDMSITDWGRPAGLKLLAKSGKSRVEQGEQADSELNLLTPAQLRVYNAAVKLSEAQLEFTKAIDAHHEELQGNKN